MFRDWLKRKKVFFFEKKKQKTFMYFVGAPYRSATATKSFLVLFFKKERLSSSRSRRHKRSHKRLHGILHIVALLRQLFGVAAAVSGGLVGLLHTVLQDAQIGGHLAGA